MDRFEQEAAEALAIRRTLGPYARAILVKTPQGNFAVPVEDLYVGQELRFKGSYSEHELQFLRSVCNSGTRLLIVGAHVGALAIPLAKICRSAVAIEANPQTFELLQFNVSLNGLKNCRAINKAASNRAEPIEFVMSRANTGGSKRKPVVPMPFYFRDNPDVVMVQADRLDDLLPGESFDVILIDIEGSEYFALQGMQRLLASAALVQIEFIPHHLRNVAAVSVADFVALMSPHFPTLCIPSKKMAVPRDQFVSILSEMFERDEGDGGLIFAKIPPDQVRFETIRPAEVNPKSPGPPAPPPA
ncbi:MAG TPA: FkbM family methyltransferase [Tepidisphaeraceae bacterium]|jgi:FkbM family methyltransferase|nr:FkbM family methyltransferase [Tepidisphaeraceae bacterium]